MRLSLIPGIRPSLQDCENIRLALLNLLAKKFDQPQIFNVELEGRFDSLIQKGLDRLKPISTNSPLVHGCDGEDGLALGSGRIS
jgi:hypothetical protein